MDKNRPSFLGGVVPSIEATMDGSDHFKLEGNKNYNGSHSLVPKSKTTLSHGKLGNADNNLLFACEGSASNLEPLNPANPEIQTDEIQNQDYEEEFEEYDEEQFDYEYDDLIIDELQVLDKSPLPFLAISEEEMRPILNSDDPPFTEKDLDDFINNEQIDHEVIPMNSEGYFHSMQNSIHSSTLVVVKMGKLVVNHTELSNSTSSKRKIIDGMDDTATSEVKEGTKPKS